MLSYILARKGYTVTKTDISPAEAKFIGNLENLSFEVQDARQLSYGEATFDLVVAVSVIEHIYGEPGEAINEMIRVVRPGGYLYLTFPVAGEHLEEWTDSDLYGSQARKGQEVFFQYRFGPAQYQALREGIPDSVELVAEDIYWERENGLYDRLVNRLRKAPRWAVLAHIRAAALNLLTGPFFFEAEPGDFVLSRSFGNAQWILRVKEGQVE
jgi:SAM-dependent methyltransferase